MSMDYLFAVIMAALAYLSVSAGLVLMKKGIDWLGWKRDKNSEYYRNMVIWITGFIVMNIYGVPSAIALKVLPAHVVSAFAGWGIVAVILLSAWLLKEKIVLREMFYSSVIVVSITMINLLKEESTAFSDKPEYSGLFVVALLPLLLIPLNRFFDSRRVQAVAWAVVAGSSAGLMVIFLKLLVTDRGYNIAEYFSSGWLWLYIFYALLSLVAIQMACKKGEMVEIGPVQYSANILWPLVAAALVFNEAISYIQYLLFLMVIGAVFMILRKRVI